MKKVLGSSLAVLILLSVTAVAVSATATSGDANVKGQSTAKTGMT